MNYNTHRTTFAAFTVGFAVATMLRLWDKRKTSKKQRENAGTSCEGNDGSLFVSKKRVQSCCFSIYRCSFLLPDLL